MKENDINFNKIQVGQDGIVGKTMFTNMDGNCLTTIRTLQSEGWTAGDLPFSRIIDGREIVYYTMIKREK
ncbi:MAG: hypothetical protein LBK26_03675 [Rickettsiales bacterium]|jgi:hypothetical protein|nr:hypothetical protein [Rickettsiales bacterium]